MESKSDMCQDRAKNADVGQVLGKQQILVSVPARVDDELWQEFLRRLNESGQTLEEYFTYAIRDEIENALFHDERLLEPEPQE